MTPEWLMKYRARRKTKAVEILGGACTRCGTTLDLQFDHVRGRKKNNVATMIRSHSWDDIVAELKKCQLLCRPCHAKKSGMERRDENHGRVNKYKRGCRCHLCVEVMRSTNRRYKAAWKQRQQRVTSIEGDAPGS